MSLITKTTPSLKPIEQMLERMDVKTVFGQPTQQDNVTIIPVAEVSFRFGYGHQFEQDEEDHEKEQSGGGGGGADGRATPRGYVQITPRDVTYKEILDPGRIALASLAFSAWAVYWIARTVRAFARKK
ncbi:MAG: hypothetical protein MI924_35300 [Chloroflexales bacterium]|nr:hypothetical protein [Chloroflexales bacterium]